MPSVMSWPSKAVAVMPSRAARDVSRALVASLMRNDVLVATSNLPRSHSIVSHCSSNALHGWGGQKSSQVMSLRGRPVAADWLRRLAVEEWLNDWPATPKGGVLAGERPSVATLAGSL